MTEEQKLQWLRDLLASGARVAQINLGDGTQNIQVNAPREEETRRPCQADTDVRQALADLYEATFEEDGVHKPLFQDQAQWYAVYRVLTEYCAYPAKMTDFVRLVQERGYAPHPPLCDYSSLKKAPQHCSRLACRPDLWQQFSTLGENYHKQWRVAEFLLERLRMG